MRTLTATLFATMTATMMASGCAATAPQTKAAPATPTAARLAENPNDAEATFVQGEHAEADGDLARAEQYYVRAEQLGIDPSRTLPRVLGVLVSSERLGEALSRCQAWMAANPDGHARPLPHRAHRPRARAPARGGRGAAHGHRRAAQRAQALSAPRAALSRPAGRMRAARARCSAATWRSRPTAARRPTCAWSWRRRS